VYFIQIRRPLRPLGQYGSEALDVLHQAMRPALHGCIAMAIEIILDFPDFFCLVDFVVGNNHLS
jgi:hypothetical protein